MLEGIWADIAASSWIEWLGMVTGVLGVWLSIREKVAAWPLFITCYGAYTYISFQSGMFAALGMNVIFIGLSVYGWLSWSRAASTVETAREITRTPRAQLRVALALWGVGTVLVGWLLDHYTEDAYRPFVDAFAGCGALVAQWMLSRKYLGTWICWTISDAVFITLWSAQSYWLTVALYLVFIGLAVHGWISWHRSLKQAPAPR